MVQKIYLESFSMADSIAFIPPATLKLYFYFLNMFANLSLLLEIIGSNVKGTSSAQWRSLCEHQLRSSRPPSAALEEIVKFRF